MIGPLDRGSSAIDPAALVEALARIEPRAAGDPAAVRVVRAPGRVNLIGEHTDYNEGFVLPIAIDRSITIALARTDDGAVTVTRSESDETASFRLDAIGSRTGTWIDYIAGTAWAMQEAGLAVHGFRGLLASDLPQGAGLSSSAALELASALALSGGEDPRVDRMALARIAQRGENAYVGVASGLMDQFASALGVAGSAMLLDCRSLEYRAVPLHLGAAALVVCDSGSSRRLDRSAYNERRGQCEAAVAAIAAGNPGIRSLRDVTPAVLDAIEPSLDPLLARRARHVVEEDARVLDTVAALEAVELERVGTLFSESHASLRDLYEVSSLELDALVDIASEVPGVLGSRLTGAGFGGCTVTLVRRDSIEGLAEAVAERYPARTGLTPRLFEVRPADGAEAIHGWG
jgi:galactokinase